MRLFTHTFEVTDTRFKPTFNYYQKGSGQVKYFLPAEYYSLSTFKMLFAIALAKNGGTALPTC